MSKSVVILGAGASKGIGLPLLNDIFKDQPVRDYLNYEAKELLKFLKERMWAPRSLDIDSSNNGLNIEEVLTLLKQWQGTTTSPILEESNDILRRQLFGCINRAVYTNKGGTSAGNAYNPFISWCDSQYDHITWMTFNWDAKLEQAFYHLNNKVGSLMPRCNSLLVDWEGRNAKHLLLKLHGSVSWFEDENHTVKAVRFGSFKRVQLIDDYWNQYLSGKSGYSPVIAEPSFFKHIDIDKKPILREQFEEALRELSEVAEVIVCGYSLPDGDIKAKQTILTSLVNNNTAKWTVVDPNITVLNNYKRLVGHGRVKTHQVRFEDYVQTL